MVDYISLLVEHWFINSLDRRETEINVSHTAFWRPQRKWKQKTDLELFACFFRLGIFSGKYNPSF